MPAENVIHILIADDDQGDGYLFARALKKIAIPTKPVTPDNGEQLMDSDNF